MHARRTLQERIQTIDRGARQRDRTAVGIGLDLRIRDEVREPALPYGRRRLGQRYQIGRRYLFIASLDDVQPKHHVPGMLVEYFAREDVAAHAADLQKVLGSACRFWIDCHASTYAYFTVALQSKSGLQSKHASGWFAIT
jgi:hypothetical protein